MTYVSVSTKMVNSFVVKSIFNNMGVDCSDLYLAKFQIFQCSKHASRLAKILYQKMGYSTHISKHLWPEFFIPFFFRCTGIFCFRSIFLPFYLVSFGIIINSSSSSSNNLATPCMDVSSQWNKKMAMICQIDYKL